MKRHFLALALLVSCLDLATADAQQPTSPRHIGVLLGLFSQESKEVQAFREGLRDAGYVEGHDVVIEWRSSAGDYALVPRLVADLVQRKVDVIVVDTTVTTRAAKRATTTIPIVMSTIADPVGTGLVASLAHPGGNITGLTVMTTDLSAKRPQLLKEAIPRLTRLAVLWNPDTPYHPKAIEELKPVAPSLSIQLSFVGARTSKDPLLSENFLLSSRSAQSSFCELECSEADVCDLTFEGLIAEHDAFASTSLAGWLSSLGWSRIGLRL